MADIVLDAAAKADTTRGLRALVFTTASIGYFFFIDADDDFKYVKTTDGGASWGTPVVIRTGTVLAFDVWFEPWTDGDTGTVIHTWCVDSGAADVFYRPLDTAADTLGTERTVFNGASTQAGVTTWVTGTKARGGNLYCVLSIDTGVEHATYRSTDAGVTWVVRTNLQGANTGEQAQLFPGNEADAQDVWVLYHNAGNITLKVIDDSANTVATSATILAISAINTNDTGQYAFTGAIRHSDGHLILVAWTERDSATGDLRIFDITNGTTWTEKTALATNKDDSYYVSLFIDQGSGDLYVAYVGKLDGSETLDTTASIAFVKSTDGGASWAAEVLYSAAAADWRRTWVPQAGPRFAVVWRDLSSQQLTSNFDNSIIVGTSAAVFAADLRGELQATAPPDLVVPVAASFAVDLRGELQASPPSLTSAAEVLLRGELQAVSRPNLQIAPTFAVSLRGELQSWPPSLAVAKGPPFVRPGILLSSVSITEQLDAVSSATLTPIGFAPRAGHPIEIRLDEQILFSGVLLSDLLIREGARLVNGRPVTATGPEWALTRRRVTKRYHQQSATAIIRDLLSVFPSINLSRVQANLPTIATIGFANETILEAVKKVLLLVGGHMRFAYPNFLIAAVQEADSEDPAPLTPAHPTMTDFTIQTDISQVVNRLKVIGAGASVIPPPIRAAPNYFDPEFDPLNAIDRTKFYPPGSQRIYLDRVEIESPEAVDEDGLPLDPPQEVPPLRIFGGGGTAVIDGTEVRYNGAGLQRFNTVGPPGRSDALQLTSRPGGDLGTVTDIDALPPFTLTRGRFDYRVTYTTQWGESTAVNMSSVELSSGMEFDFTVSPYVQIFTPHRQVLVELIAAWDKDVTAINVYRSRDRLLPGADSDDFFRVGSVGPGGGAFVDNQADPPPDTPNELPREDTSARPPMAYVDIEAQPRPIRVGASIRIVETFNDLPSQSVLRVLLSHGSVIDDGIVEGDPVDDETLTYQELGLTARAHLRIKAPIQQTVTWTSRDRRTHPFADILVDMPDGARGVFKIQRVLLDGFEPAHFAAGEMTSWPLHHATASSSLFTLTDVLRRRAGA